MIISVDSKNQFDKIQHPLVITKKRKTQENRNSEISKAWREHLQSLQLTLHSMLKVSVRAFLLKSGTKQVYLLSSLLFKIVLVVLDSAIRQERAIKRHTDLQRKSKTVPICRCKIFYIENLSEPTRNLLEAN